MGDLENRLVAAATPHFFKGVSDAITKQLVEYYWLEKNGRIFYDQSGRGVEWRVRTRRGSPIGYSGVEGIAFTGRNDFDVASLAFRGIADGIMLTWQELEQAKGKEAIFNLLDEVLGNLEADLLYQMQSDFYGDGTGLNAKTIHGLAASISSGANLTYAGISQSTTAAWANQAVSGAGFNTGTNSIAKLLALKVACAKGEKGGKSRNRINLMLSDGTVWQTVMTALQGQQRFIADAEMVKAGFENAIVYGVPITWSEAAPAATVYGLNSKLFGLYCTTSDVFKSFNEWTIGLPKVYLACGVSCMNLINMNPRGSGLIYTIN